MKRITISVFLSALLLTGCSNQNQSNTTPETTTLSSESTTTAETSKPEYPTRTINHIENVTVTVPELPDFPADSLQFIDCRREIEGREPQEYLQAYLKKICKDPHAEDAEITALSNQNGIRIWKTVSQQQILYAAEKHYLYYFMKCENENEALKELLNEMQIDDSKVHYAYNPDNDQCEETAYCYSQLSAEEQKIYDEMRQMLTPATMPDHPKWTRSNVTEEEAKQLNRIVAGINLDFDEEVFFHELKSTYQNGVFTVQSERTITAAPAEQVDKENEEGYRFACEKADAIIAAMPPNLTRYGKYLYLAKAVCDMVQYDDSHPTYITYRIRGAFEDGKTICTGYTDAYAFLCHRAGLYCISIGGNGHAWNGIRLNNELYHFDTTWMDSGCNGTYNYLFAQPFTSDEYGHADCMMDFFDGLPWFPGWSDMILNTGSINWEKELEAPAII